MAREEFNIERKACDCWQCATGCVEIPGYLIPADLERLHALEPKVPWEDWARDHLEASPGALVVVAGETIRIPTLVPRMAIMWKGCHWLRRERCAVHEVAPFGCAFFSVCSMDARIDDYLTQEGLRAVMEDWARGGPYSVLWQLLWSENKRADGPEVRRARQERRLR